MTQLKITKDKNVYYIEGVIDEHADFTPITQDTTSELVVNFRGVTRINSCGVREWINAVRQIQDRRLKYEECSEAIVEQFNMIPNFVGAGEVISFFVPYICPDCDEEVKKIFKVAEFAGQNMENYTPPTFPCDNCGGELQFDEDEAEYFIFIEEQLRKLKQ